jgi:hypothetical protein
MVKKTTIFFLCCTLMSSFTVFDQAGLAADVETNGNLTVHGVIESASGGFRFPDGSTLTTVGVTGTPVAHGVVNAAGIWGTFSHSSNVSAVGHTLAGVYEIVVSGESMNFQNYTTVISMADTGPGFTSHIYTTNGHLLVTTYNTGGAVANMAFAFIIMKK